MGWSGAGKRLTSGLDGLNRAGRWLVDRFDGKAAVAVSAVTYPLELALSVPFVGRGLGSLWRVVLALIWASFAVPYGLLALVGVRPEMRLRVHMLLGTEAGALSDQDWRRVLQGLEIAARVLQRGANVRIVWADAPGEALLPGNEGRPQARPAVIEPGLGAVACNLAALWEDLGPIGGRIERAALRAQPKSSCRRISGCGAPLAIILVDQVGEAMAGCSLGPLTDYVTVKVGQPLCIGHELAHACNLWHRPQPRNLMNPTCGGVHLAPWQVATLRLSRHVTAW